MTLLWGSTDATFDTRLNSKNLADELLFGKLKNGGSVKIEFDEQSEKIYLKWPKLNGGARQDTKTSPESIEI